MYVLTGFYLGLQRSFTSSLLVTFFSITNIVFSVFFVISLNLGIYGVALGTVLSAYLTVIIFSVGLLLALVCFFSVILLSSDSVERPEERSAIRADFPCLSLR